ncbi:MAG: hypothetical protein V3S08_02660 [Phycisphaerales bacterium]
MFGRRDDQHNAENTKCRQSIHKPQEVADQSSNKTGMPSAQISDTHADDPFPDRGSEATLKNAEVAKHRDKVGQAKRIEDEPAGHPVVITGRHEPDPLYQPRHRKEDGTPEQAVDGEC